MSRWYSFTVLRVLATVLLAVMVTAALEVRILTYPKCHAVIHKVACYSLIIRLCLGSSFQKKLIWCRPRPSEKAQLVFLT